MAMDAGMETCRVRRSNASASGRITIAASAAEMTAFSPNAASQPTSSAAGQERLGRVVSAWPRHSWLACLVRRAVFGDQAQGFIESVCRDYLAAHFGIDGFHKTAPIVFQLLRNRTHLKAALFHGLKGFLAFRAALRPDFLPGVGGGLEDLFLLVRSERVPHPLGHDRRANQRNIVYFQEILGCQVKLAGKGVEGRH